MSVPRSLKLRIFSEVSVILVGVAAAQLSRAAIYSARVNDLCKAGSYRDFGTRDEVLKGTEGNLNRDVLEAAGTGCQANPASFFGRLKLG